MVVLSSCGLCFSVRKHSWLPESFLPWIHLCPEWRSWPLLFFCPWGHFNMEPELPHQKDVKAGKITFALGQNNFVPQRTICKGITTTGLMRTGQKIKLFRFSITVLALSVPTEMPSMDVIVFPPFAFVSSSEHYLAFCLSQCVRKSYSSWSQINICCLPLWKAFYFQVNMLNIFPFSFPYLFYILFNALVHITHFILGFKAKVWTTFIQFVTHSSAHIRINLT